MKRVLGPGAKCECAEDAPCELHCEFHAETVIFELDELEIEDEEEDE